MDNQKKRIRLKCRYENEIRVVIISQDYSFPQLWKRLSMDYGFDVTLKYEDVDGDLITLASQNDLDDLFLEDMDTVNVTVSENMLPDVHGKRTARTSSLWSAGGSLASSDWAKMPHSSASPSPGLAPSPTVVAPLRSAHSKTMHRFPQIETSSPRVVEKPWKWKKGEILGKGAFGVVCLGLNVETGELMAVKQMTMDDISKKELAQLDNEINTLRSLKHPNIVRYIGTELTPTTLSVFLEYVPGGSLKSLIDKFGKLEESVARSYTRQLLLGLEYLHRNGIAHRDVKGANCLVGNDGAIKLADFGASKHWRPPVETPAVHVPQGQKDEVSNRSTGSNDVRGTPSFMAPEVVRNDEKHLNWKKADVWSLGCTTIEMTTGKTPWAQFSNPVTVLYHIACADTLPEYPESPSVELLTFLNACLQRDAMNRPDITSLLLHPFVAHASHLASWSAGPGSGAWGNRPSTVSTTAAEWEGTPQWKLSTTASRSLMNTIGASRQDDVDSHLHSPPPISSGTNQHQLLHQEREGNPPEVTTCLPLNGDAASGSLDLDMEATQPRTMLASAMGAIRSRQHDHQDTKDEKSLVCDNISLGNSLDNLSLENSDLEDSTNTLESGRITLEPLPSPEHVDARPFRNSRHRQDNLDPLPRRKVKAATEHFMAVDAGLTAPSHTPVTIASPACSEDSYVASPTPAKRDQEPPENTTATNVPDSMLLLSAKDEKLFTIDSVVSTPTDEVKQISISEGKDDGENMNKAEGKSISRMTEKETAKKNTTSVSNRGKVSRGVKGRLGGRSEGAKSTRGRDSPSIRSDTSQPPSPSRRATTLPATSSPKTHIRKVAMSSKYAGSPRETPRKELRADAGKESTFSPTCTLRKKPYEFSNRPGNDRDTTAKQRPTPVKAPPSMPQDPMAQSWKSDKSSSMVEDEVEARREPLFSHSMRSDDIHDETEVYEDLCVQDDDDISAAELSEDCEEAESGPMSEDDVIDFAPDDSFEAKDEGYDWVRNGYDETGYAHSVRRNRHRKDSDDDSSLEKMTDSRWAASKSRKAKREQLTSSRALGMSPSEGQLQGYALVGHSLHGSTSLNAPKPDARLSQSKQGARMSKNSSAKQLMSRGGTSGVGTLHSGSAFRRHNLEVSGDSIDLRMSGMNTANPSTRNKDVGVVGSNEDASLLADEYGIRGSDDDYDSGDGLVTPSLNPSGVLLDEHTASVSKLRLVTSKSLLLSASLDGTVRVWSSESGNSSRAVLDTASFAPKGASTQRVSSGKKVGPKVSSVPSTQKPLRVTGMWTDEVCESIWAGCSDGCVRVWSGSEGKPVRLMKGHDELVTCIEGAETVASAMGSPHITATGSVDKTVRVWDLRAKRSQVCIFRGHSDSILSMKWVDGGKVVVSASKDRTVKLWDIRSGRLRVSLDKHFGSVNIIKAIPAHSGGGHSATRGSPAFMSAARDGIINMWSAEGDCLASHGAHRNSVNCLSEVQSYENSIEPAVGGVPGMISSGADGVVKVWDSRRLKCTSEFTAHSIVKVAWFHQSIVTGSASGNLSIWDYTMSTDSEAVSEAREGVKTWVPKDLNCSAQSCTDIASNKYCVASASKIGQIMRWTA